MEKPTIEQVAWLCKHICENWRDGGSFRYLIYDRMGYGPEAYQPLYKAGLMAINNELPDVRTTII